MIALFLSMLALLATATALHVPSRAGFVSCTMTVQSWYDSGVRLANADATGVVSPVKRSTAAVESWYDSGVRLTTVPAAPSAPASKFSSWGLMGERKVTPHRMAGTMPPPLPREVWVPPPGWTKPTKHVARIERVLAACCDMC